MNKINSIGIIGYGKFGKLLYSIFQNSLRDTKIKVSSGSNEIDNKIFFSFAEVSKCDLVIPVVPIKFFESTIQEVSRFITSGSTVLDVCSVKVHPRDVMLKYLSKDVNIIASHPMFGPGNLKKLNIDPENLDEAEKYRGLKVVINNVRSEKEIYENITNYFLELNMTLIEMTCEEHDMKTAQTQFLSLTIAKIIQSMNIQENNIMTPSAEKMIFYRDMITVDDSLVRDIYKYNPYTKLEIEKLNDEFKKFKKYIIN